MIKKILTYTLYLCIASCSSETPSISVQPSEEFFDAAGRQLKAKMDILFVIDNSVSMHEEQENMMKNFVSFIRSFVVKGFDYRIATVTTDAWMTKGFYDLRPDKPVAPSDNDGFVLMKDHISSDEYNANNFKVVDNNGNSINFDPLSYIGYKDLRFWNYDNNLQSGQHSYYERICNRNNYVSSRFAKGDYTKALIGSDRGTHNGEAGQDKHSADQRYLSDYRIVSSKDPTIDTNFYGEEKNKNLVLLVNREKSFYNTDIADVAKPSGKEHILDIFRNNLMLGLDGCYGESGLESARAALENPFNQNIDGQPFPRSDAHLAIIIVSDMRDEMSGIGNGNYQNVIPNYSLGSDNNATFSQERLNIYKDYFESISSNEFGYSVHAIVPTATEGFDLNPQYKALNPPEFKHDGSDCSDHDPLDNKECYVAIDTLNNTKADYTQIPPIDGCIPEWQIYGRPREAKMYTKMAEQTGGEKTSICGDFAEKLESIAQIIIERTTEFKLDKIPKDIDLLFVGVDYANDKPDLGFVDIPQDSKNGWSYNAIGNTVVFNGTSTPDQDARISIVFDRDSLD